MTTPEGQRAGERMDTTDVFYGIRQHIGWLKMFILDMTPENWRDMRARCEQQLNWLSDEIKSNATLTTENARLTERVKVLEEALGPFAEVPLLRESIAEEEDTAQIKAFGIEGAVAYVPLMAFRLARTTLSHGGGK